MTLYAEFTALPGNEARVKQLLLELTEQVRREPGNVSFLPFTVAADPNRFFVFEVYDGDEQFAEHIGSEYSARFNDELRGLVQGSASTLTWLKSVETEGVETPAGRD